MKPSRFITGYANYKFESISKNDTLTADEKSEQFRRIDRAVRGYENGMLTVDEAIRTINEIRAINEE